MRALPPQQPRNLFLLALLVVLCTYMALATWLPLTKSDREYHIIAISLVHYAGFLAVAVCCISYIVFRQFFRFALGVTMLLALFNLVSFLPFTMWVGITLSEVRLAVNPLILSLLLVSYLPNRSAVHAFIRKYLLPAPSPQQAARQRREAIDQFKQTFARKPDHALQQIVQERKLVADAVAAAQELLAARGTPVTAS